VTCDVFALCLKSGNACLLKGGSDAENSNQALVKILREALQKNHLNPNLCTLLPSGRKATEALLRATGSVDLLIPRGSAALIDYVRQQARVPVIETGAGVCHCYFDRTGDVEIGQNILLNAKTRRVSVCNALDCLIIHYSRLSDLPRLCSRLAERSVILYADPPACAALAGHYPERLLQPARSENFGHEFLDYKMSIRTVRTLNEALAHIARHGSRHSESIVSCSPAALRRFTQGVDAACIYHNLPTSFSDGAQFGFGAEIGISTQKLHARGPMALPELTTYKYIISGAGQIRED
jgi:glutamate-5-semialdehyde dehydrogenase